jgi:hypothetical protein
MDSPATSEEPAGSESPETPEETTDADRPAEADDARLDQLAVLTRIVRGEPRRPGLVQVLPRLQQTHRKELIRVERWTTGDLARHPEPRALIRSRRRPGNLDEHGRLRRVFDQRRVLTADVHENRVVLHVVKDVRARLVELVDAGEADAAALLWELDGAVATAVFLEDLTELRQLPRTPTATLQSDPLYRTVFRAWVDLLDAGERGAA